MQSRLDIRRDRSLTPGRLVVLSDYFGAVGANTGGVGIAALDSFNILQRLGVDVRMIGAFGIPAHLEGAPEATLLGGHDLRDGSRSDFLKGLYNPEAPARLRAALAGYDPHTTVIVLNQWTRWLSPSVMGLLSHYRLMVYMHDYFWFCPNGAYYVFPEGRPCTLRPMSLACATSQCDRGGYAHKVYRLARHAAKDMLAGSDPASRVILHLSQSSHDIVAPFMPAETHRVIYNPLNPDVPQPGSGRRPPAMYDVGYFGRIEPEKGVDALIEALESGGYSGLFVGDGSRAGAVARSTARISQMSWAGHAEALALMRRCRVVVLPSTWPETWGLVTAEAMAQGVPVVVSRAAGSSELVTRFGGGAVFDPAKPGDLSAALRSVLEDVATDTGSTARQVRRALAPQSHGRRMIEVAAEVWGLDLLA